ncbi:MAG TPA: GatB/YqeY domain-containing protein [Tenuifilaceae bacterium]|nr:GatB/YqeY domain-containing protein [Tenuifilaceae bacterium]HPE17619.1 GatB/YqeY domain-containing protein [Tenuifilaceae bacterium]HPJ44978.1 GatB/YqeY domain-containing protein [Tenuifilaceae bacterium]HPQ33775.1 GatB/YqeY domain-containing protein [Tenuifilaceae bacterium]HRX67667.1 GatB/YqeY domain-containing protein [Tenuifilaceae bacterium]
MTLEERINNDIKAAMLAKEKIRLEALRAVKSAILLAKTEKGGSEGLTTEAELKLLQKQVKQRKDSAEIYQQQNRPELADKELAEAAAIEEYLPKMLSDEELTSEVKKLIEQVGAKSPADMGKVMGLASKSLAGKAEGKAIADKVKSILAAM